ncbi:MAG TPA: right-handed parallel beta-helix repeat-containing protein [Thermoanaerobaculia bacterium]|nr:right-handed parallel beta-helix repeat-containing protein [Thermoanaerobaculia bacterium]
MDIRSSRLLLALLAFLLVPSLSFAQATRTWVSGVGDDANPCSRTAPCKTFAGAISKTAAKGEINVLDPGGFGGVTITKSISIVSDHIEAGVLVSGTNAIIVNAGATDVVVLRGLDIEGLGTGLNGVRFLAGGALHVERCSFRGFAQKAIDFEPSGSSNLFVLDSVMIDNAAPSVGGAIFIKPSGTGSAIGSIDNTRMVRNHFGVHVEGAANITVSNSVASANSTSGFEALNTNAAIGLMVTNSTATSNGIAGVRSDGLGTIVRVTDTTLFGNANGLQTANGGQIISGGDIRNLGNTTGGTPNSAVAPQ